MVGAVQNDIAARDRKIADLSTRIEDAEAAIRQHEHLRVELEDALGRVQAQLEAETSAKSVVDKRLLDTAAAMESAKRRCAHAEEAGASLTQRLEHSETTRQDLEHRLGLAESEVRPPSFWSDFCIFPSPQCEFARARH